MSKYREMLKEGLVPDVYTFNALLTSMSRVGASFYAVQDFVGEMNKWGVKVGIKMLILLPERIVRLLNDL